MTTTQTTSTFDRMTSDDRWLGFGYLGSRQYADDAEVALADAFVFDVTADWTDDELFTWANSKDGRWFADILFGGSWTQADLDMAGRYVRKQR